ncbi:class I SAM-dependent methyltransferase [Dyella sp. 2RAB6]|uniref:class I SAM-dependent methyltransferase n=1 Tax=Dyella sp. 2RAB6 TaxID=3232992 RepID=UPI003F8F22C7
MSNDYLHSVREYELGLVIAELPGPGSAQAGVRVLDIGAGTGHQSALLQAHGYRVTAVDLPVSSYAAERVFPVVDYDGTRLPLPDSSVDVVFSSNVLEHVSSIGPLLDECRRVMASGALAVHVLPTPAWRWWTSLTHYPWLFTRVWRRLAGPVPKGKGGGGKPPRPWWTMLWPERHGERGTTLTEARYFSERCWQAMFAEAGFRVEKSYPTGLFYTGNMLFAERLPISARRWLSRWLGSSCRVYVMRVARAGRDGS